MNEFTRKRDHTREEAIVSENPFNRLPDDLVTCILNRLVDMKYLCHCSIVSKRFASLIPLSPSVSIVVPISQEERTEESCIAMLDLLLTVCEAHTFEEIPEPLVPSLQKLKLPKFLESFTDLETIHIEYEDPTEINNNISSFPMWKAKFCSSPMVASLVTILPSLTYKESEEADLENVLQEFSPNYDKRHRDIALWLALQSCMEWLCLTCMLVRAHNSLKSITITDVNGRGKLVLMEEQLINMRSSFQIKELAMMSQIHFTRIPVVRLPSSGWVLRDVLIYIFSFPGKSCTNGDIYEEILSWDFDSNEEILGQALEEIFKNFRYAFEVGQSN